MGDDRDPPVPPVPPALARHLDDALAQRLVSLRRELHRDPELSGAETRTAARLESALRELRGVEVVRMAGTGVLCCIPGAQSSAPRVAIRGDIDALPIVEATGLTFASRNDGVMHACGHDVHAAWAVGAASLLARAPARGEVVVLLQPAEETGRGALQMIDAGALERVGAIFGAHVDRRFDIGTVVADAGPLAASSDSFTIELSGQGAHAARPHEGRDPVLGAAQLVVALQSVVSRRLDPAASGVLAVSMLHAGTASNVMPDRSVLRGTIRAADASTRVLLQEELRRITEGVATTFGLSARVAIDEGPPPVINAERPTTWARQAAEQLLGADSVAPLGTRNMAAEDFAHYLARVPGCFLRVGAREPGGPTIPAHSPSFAPDECAVYYGSVLLAECARVASLALSEDGA